MDELYREYRKGLSAIGTAAMLKAKAEGAWTHRAPFGYRIVRDEANRPVLEADPAKIHLVLFAQKLYRQGVSIRKVQHVLFTLGLRSSNGKKVSVSLIHRIVQVPATKQGG